MAKRKIKVVYKKLGRENAWGRADDYIEIDPRIFGKKHLEVLVHECLHVLCPELTEEQVTRKAILLCNTLWHEHYRRTDNTNPIPLQDGSK